MTRILRPTIFVCLVSVLALLAGASPTFAVPVEEIPSPRPAGWSVDLTGSIPAENLRAIDALGDQIKTANGAEIAVVWIDTTGGAPSRDFARRLFDQWGIGDKDKNNGILILAALNDRSAEIVLGQGLDTPANNQVSGEIMQGEMIPLFRAGDPGGALLAGARACTRRILDVAPPLAETATPMPLLAETSAPVEQRATEVPLPAYIAPLSERPFTDRPDPSQPGGLIILSILGLCLAGAGYLLMRTPRCSRCKIKMTLLSEQEDDAHLTPAERTEERVESVDHEIWLCSQCGEMKKRSLKRFFSGYSWCLSCRAKTVQSISNVIERPTYSSSGTRRVDTSCAHCGRADSYTVAIPRMERPRPAQSSSGYQSHSSSSGGSSSSSSPSSGSSDYGGGSSSGGGASGKW